MVGPAGEAVVDLYHTVYFPVADVLHGEVFPAHIGGEFVAQGSIWAPPEVAAKHKVNPGRFQKREINETVVAGNQRVADSDFLAFSIMYNNMIRAEGFPRMAMYTLLIQAVLNSALDPV